VANIQSAARDWERACRSCNVSITYDGTHDQAPDNQGLTFIVRFDPNATDFIALSFFKNQPVDARFLTISPDYFTTTFNRVGVFRHELGHILGYRHEQVSGVEGCDDEDALWEKLTEYDKLSAMHYLCGKGGTREMALSEHDIQGHRILYGG